VPNGQGGILVVKRPWPSMLRNVWGDPKRYQTSYFPEELGGKLYLAGDGAVRYREALAAVGAQIPPDGSPLHVPHARHHAALHATAGPPDPCYLRAPDADRSLALKAAG